MFKHEGWTVDISSGKVDIDNPCGGWGTNVDVYAEEEGLFVFGSDSCDWHEGPKSVTIPWAVVEAIIEARKAVKNG